MDHPQHSEAALWAVAKAPEEVAPLPLAAPAASAAQVVCRDSV